MNKKDNRLLRLIIIGTSVIGNSAVWAADDAGLAQELTNPIADIMTIPIQMNFDNDIGRNDEGSKITTNVQPVIPFKLNENWNIITRTIFPIISQDKIYPGAGSQSGLGDITEQLFFSPKKPTAGGIIWGVGAVFMVPTATDSKLGTSGRDDISNTFMQPFAAYTWPSAWTAAVQSESNYNWKSERWSIPVNVALSKLVFLGKLPVSVQAGVGYWLESPDTGPEGIRYRLQANIVLPKK